MTVTQIAPSPDRGGRHRVEFSDGTVLKLLPSVIGDAGLYTGMTLDEQAFDALVQAGRTADTKQRAIHIISATTVSSRDLDERLRQKGATAEDAAQTVQWLAELGLLDDAVAARQIVERGVRRGYGTNRIRQMLYEKKIPRSLWDEALAAIPPMDDAVDAFLRERLHGDPDEKLRKRTVDALLRRGFSWSEIKDGLRRYGEAPSEPWEDV